MTTVSLAIKPSRIEITVSGHADRDPGEDANLVCTAISTLTQTLRQSLANECRGGYAEETASGYTKIILSGRICLGWIASLRNALTGYLLLQNKYPEKICVMTDGAVNSSVFTGF